MVNKTILKNGITIVSKKMPHVRSVSMGVWVNVGARDESASESGLSHFIEHMIFKGTKKRTAFQIAKAFDAIGGQTNAFTSMEHTCYHAKVVDSRVETMVDILSDIFLNSVFDENEVEKERLVIFQEIGMVEDSPEEYIHQKLGSAFWGDNALGRSILGNKNNILNINAETIKRFFGKLYQPDRIVISVAGNVDHDRFVTLVGPAFETVKQHNHGFATRSTPKGRSIIEISQRDLEQVHICFGAKGVSVASDARYAMSLMNTIMGGNMSSRLFQKIREERGLAYSIYSFVTSYADTGMFGIYTGVEPKQVEETISLIFEVVKGMIAKGVSPEELKDAKAYTKGNLLLASENPDNQMVRLAQNEFYFGEYMPLKSVIKNIDAVSRKDIIEHAKRVFTSDCFAVASLGPFQNKKILEDAMADFTEAV